jgi:hypothetical protein
LLAPTGIKTTVPQAARVAVEPCRRALFVFCLEFMVADGVSRMPGQHQKHPKTVDMSLHISPSSIINDASFFPK